MIHLLTIVQSLPLMQLSDSLMSPHFDSALGIYCSIAWFATIFGGIFFLLTFIGAGFADIGLDTGADTGHGAGGYFSIHAIIGFLLGLGWGGFICMEQGMAALPASLVGLFIGAIMFVLILGLMRMLTRLQVDGNTDMSSLAGLTGTVYVSIPPSGAVGGQVQITHPNGVLTLPATQRGETELPAHTPITVIESTPQGVLVQALSS
ncbi:MAG: hypothetical protein R3Y56_00140 [Akkermansia sp.]